MRALFGSITFVFLMTSGVYADSFLSHFSDKTFRLDYIHLGGKGEESFIVDQLMLEGEWPGSMTNLIDTLNLGEYSFRIIDLATSKVLYTRGYSTMFSEWQTTDEAVSGAKKAFHESLRFPFPLRQFQVSIGRRNSDMSFRELFSTVIDPSSNIIHREAHTVTASMNSILKNGSPKEKVDLVILGDGYSKTDLPQFREDAKHFVDVLFGTKPFSVRKQDFNIWTVEVESPQSGIDQPDQNIWTRNSLNTSYNTFGSARYVLTEDNKTLRDYASLAPYDFIAILINNKRYGGGGIFQQYITCFSTGETKETAWQADYVFVHELGHAFGGLGDEYYSSSVAYNEFYPKDVEPWEPNIARDCRREKLKWSNLVAPSTPLPTSWNKDRYDSLETIRANLKRSDPQYQIKRSDLLAKERAILADQTSKDVVGAFEGAGYSPKGLYRPAVDCRMFSLSLVDFDPVCSLAIHRMIDFYSK